MNTVKVLRVGFINESYTEIDREYHFDADTISLETLLKFKIHFINVCAFDIGEMEYEAELNIITEEELLQEMEAHVQAIQESLQEEGE